MSAVRKDYRVSVKVTNNNLLTALAAKGHTSIQTFAMTFNFQYKLLLDLVNMKLSPLTSAGEILPMVERLIFLLEMPFDDLFNEQQVEGFVNNRSETEVTAESMFTLTNLNMYTGLLPEDVAEDEHTKNAVANALSVDNAMSVREIDVLKKRFGFEGPVMTLKQIGDIYGVGPAWIGQIEAKALRKLRHPSRSGVLKDLFYGNEVETPISETRYLEHVKVYKTTSEIMKIARQHLQVVRKRVVGELQTTVYAEVQDRYQNGSFHYYQPRFDFCRPEDETHNRVLYWRETDGTVLEIEQFVPRDFRSVPLEHIRHGCIDAVKMQIIASNGRVTDIHLDTLPPMGELLDRLLDIMVN